MGVYEGRGQLVKGMKALMLRWGETRSQWDDAVSRSFEEKHLHPLEQDLRSALGAMDQMANLIHQIERDCR